LQKFYRINGGSTQLKGVTPHIILPDQYENLKYREKDNPDALPWDEIQKAAYPMVGPTYEPNNVRQKSMERVAANPIFNAIKESSALTEKMNQRIYSLQLIKYRDEQKKIRDAYKKIDDAAKVINKLQVNILPSDSTRLSPDQDKFERRKQWITNISKDVYINETTQVVSDMIGQGVLVRKSA
jgi:carboxyl-terminal processing protease